MGLDMYVYAVPGESVIDDFHFDHDPIMTEEIWYWRKHHDLHGWMWSIAREKGGPNADDFNCVPVRLTQEDLLRLIDTIKADALPTTRGFFFGNNPPNEDSNKKDLAFVEKALALINKGKAIYYDSSW